MQDDGRETIYYANAPRLKLGGTVLVSTAQDYLRGSSYAGVGFSLGGAVTVDIAKTRLPGSLGQYFWGGATGSAFWIDPKEELAVVFMTQMMFC